MELNTIVNTSEQERYEQARKKVDAIKAFHTHITVYIIVNIFLILIKTNIISAFDDKEFVLRLDPWLELNTYGTLILWGIGLGIHGLYVYRHKFKFLKRWEDRKIREIIKKEENENL